VDACVVEQDIQASVTQCLQQSCNILIVSHIDTFNHFNTKIQQ
jgi:hypothetical protein